MNVNKIEPHVKINLKIFEEASFSEKPGFWTTEHQKRWVPPSLPFSATPSRRKLML